MTCPSESRTRRLALRASCVACAAAGVVAPAMADGRNRPGGFKPATVSPLGVRPPQGAASGAGGAPDDPFPDLAGGPGSLRTPESEIVVTSSPRVEDVSGELKRAPAVHILQPVINGVAQSESIMVPILDGKIMLPEEFLDAKGLIYDSGGYELGGRRFALAGDIAGARTGVELDAGRLVMDCAASCFQPDVLAARDHVRGEMSPVALGGYANYEIFGQQGDGPDSFGALVQGGVFSQAGTGAAQVSCSSLREDGSCLRLDTNWTIDNPNNVTRLRLGDSITKAERWGRPARFGGVAWGTDFSLDPGFITFPSPSLTGESVLPGTVDILINDQKRFSGDVEPGPFSITDVPLITGAGTATVVVRDTLGRETAIDTAYYAAPQLLKKGLSRYSVETGFLRENYGIRSNNYGEGFLAGGYARGVSDTLTLGARSELSADRQTAGVSAAVLNPRLGVSEAAVAVSSDEGTRGLLTSLRHEYRSSKFTIGANVEHASEDYRGLGEVGPRPQLSSRAFVGMDFGGVGHGNLNWTYRDEWDGDSFSSVGVGWSAPVGRSTLHLSAFQALEPSREFFATLRMSVPLGPGVSSGGLEYRRRRLGGRASYRVTPNMTGGFGYNLGASSVSSGQFDAGVAHRSRVADVKVEYSNVDGDEAVRETLRGGFAAVGGRFHATRAVNNSMAVVQVGESEGVRVYVDRQLSGVTDEDGKALLTNLRAYEDNQITFNHLDLGLGDNPGADAIRIRPGRRTGHVASFDITRGLNLRLRVRLEDGRPIPEGSLLRDMRLGTKYPVGSEGQIYIANAQNVSRLTYETRERRCEVDVAPPVVRGDLPIVDGGEAVCRSVAEMAAR